MARRYKSYSAETGVTYRYFFVCSRRVIRPEGQGEGSDHIFVALPDQAPPFIARVFVSERGAAARRARRGRALEPNEMYAAAKLCLLRAFDEHERLRDQCSNLIVDETNIEGLLEPLDL